VQEALVSGQIVHVAGERNVAIGGDASGSIIVTGDQAQVKLDLSDAAFEKLRERLFPTPHGIPPPFPDLIFIGREEAVGDVKKLLGLESAAAGKLRRVIVRGWPGVGKTTLVSVLSRDPDVAREFPDGVLWASLDQKPMLISTLAGWGRALGRDDLLRVPTVEEVARQLGLVLQNRRMLLIVDDVWEAAHGALFLQAQGANCGVLFTTRLPEVAQDLAQTEREIYYLDVLSEDDALKLMRILASDVVERYPAESRALVGDLERLPLALHVAARLLRIELRQGWGVTELLKDIREGAAIIKAQAPPDRLRDGTIPTVTALLQKSTSLLDEHTRDCFALLGVFAPRPATFDMEAMKSVWQVENPKPIARELVRRGLLEPASFGRFQMHALLVAHAKSLLTD
jgi:NB-ARC domain-containing protein